MGEGIVFWMLGEGHGRSAAAPGRGGPSPPPPRHGGGPPAQQLKNATLADINLLTIYVRVIHCSPLSLLPRQRSVRLLGPPLCMYFKASTAALSLLCDLLKRGKNIGLEAEIILTRSPFLGVNPKDLTCI